MRFLALTLFLALAIPNPEVATPAGAPGGPGAQEPAPSQPATAATETNAAHPPTFWLIPHTHWEGAVFKTREEYLEEGLPHILQALDLLRNRSEYRFVLDQVAYVKPFLERYPSEAAEFRKFVDEGRLEIVGGNDVMLDVNIPSGESWIRQALYGKRYYHRALGVDVKTGWGLDTFGHHAQMPQLLKLAGYDSYWFQRGVHGNKVPSEFLWQGIDGTKIPAFWLPYGYGLFYPVPKNFLEFDRYARAEWDALGGYSAFPDRVAMAGADVISPEPELLDMVKMFDDFNALNADNVRARRLFTRFGTPQDYERLVAARADHPVVSGELNPVFQGVYSSRIELKQWMREDERILTTSEKLGALAAVVGSAGAPRKDGSGDDDTGFDRRWQAWEPVLFNQAHDLTSGTMVDKVYLETIRGYEFAKDLGNQAIGESLDSIAARIDTRGPEARAIPILVVNSLGWPRTDVAEAEVGFSLQGVSQLDLETPGGEHEPLQILNADRYRDGGIRHATIAFIARDVPAMGWAVYRLTPQQEGPRRRLAPSDGQELGDQADSNRASNTMHVDTGSIENQFYRARFDLWTGAMTGLDLKSAQGDWDVLGNRPANVVAQEPDGGDFWELYGTLNGGRLTAMTRQQGVPETGRSRLSSEWVGGSGRTNPGPVFSEFSIDHPFGEGSFSTRVRVYNGIRRIDVETKILNNDKFVRYRLVVPTSIKNGRRFDEIPFGAIQRPESQEFPAQNWIDYSDGSHGLSLLNVGQPGSNVADGALLLSLMRSARISAYPFFGGYEPGVSSDLGLELGQARTFHYALVPHAGGWQDALTFRAGLEFNNPLIARPLSQHPGGLPAEWGLLEIAPSNVVLSAVTPVAPVYDRRPQGKGGKGNAEGQGEHGQDAGAGQRKHGQTKGGQDSQGQGIIVRVYEAAGRSTAGARIRFKPVVVSAQEVNLMEQKVADASVKDNAIEFDLRAFEIKTFKVTLRPVL